MSLLIKQILEQRYGATVPFDQQKVRAAWSSKLISKALRGQPAPGDWCGALTPVLLASAASATTGLQAPLHMYPSGDEATIRSTAKTYLHDTAIALKQYCDKSARENVIVPLEKFLGDYAAAVKSRLGQEATEQRRFADEKQRQLDAAQADKVRREAEEDARKTALLTKQQALQRAKQEAEQKIRQAQAEQNAQARQRAQAKRAAYAAELKNGTKPVLSVNDAKTFYDAASGLQIITTPPVVPDENVYAVNGTLKRANGSQYVFEVLLPGGPFYFMVDSTSTTKMQQKFQLRFGAPASIIGRFTDTAEYLTVAGETRNAAVFDGLFIGD